MFKTTPAEGTKLILFTTFTQIFLLQTWRERTGDKPEREQVDMLEAALTELGRNDLLMYIGR